MRGAIVKVLAHVKGIGISFRVVLSTITVHIAGSSVLKGVTRKWKTHSQRCAQHLKSIFPLPSRCWSLCMKLSLSTFTSSTFTTFAFSTWWVLDHQHPGCWNCPSQKASFHSVISVCCFKYFLRNVTLGTRLTPRYSCPSLCGHLEPGFDGRCSC